jgi:hypothetical protein
MPKNHSLKSNYDIIAPKGHYYGKNTSIKASWGTAYDAEEIVRADRNKAECHQ